MTTCCLSSQTPIFVMPQSSSVRSSARIFPSKVMVRMLMLESASLLESAPLISPMVSESEQRYRFCSPPSVLITTRSFGPIINFSNDLGPILLVCFVNSPKNSSMAASNSSEVKLGEKR